SAHVDLDIRASEKGLYARRANLLLEAISVETSGLRLSRQDQAARVGDGCFEHLPREKHEADLDDREHATEKRNDDQREFDRRRAVLVTPEAALARKNGEQSFSHGGRRHPELRTF